MLDAFAEIVTDVPLTVPGGTVIDTVVVLALLIVMNRAAEVVRFPAVSRATAVKTCEPFTACVVSQVIAYGAVVVSAPRLVPSNLN